VGPGWPSRACNRSRPSCRLSRLPTADRPTENKAVPRKRQEKPPANRQSKHQEKIVLLRFASVTGWVQIREMVPS